MGIVLGPNQYGKAETRLVAVTREGDVHSIKDLTVSTALRGDLAATHLTGDNSEVLATDTQKNTVYAFAEQAPVGEIEDFALRLARHFVGAGRAITGARVRVDEHPWSRIGGNGHSFVQAGNEKRTTEVVVESDRAWVTSGVRDLVVLKTTGSEFRGFPRDRYTTLPETDDRVLATSVTARWRYQGDGIDWADSATAIRAALLDAFATKHSRSLQQTLYAMGEAVLLARPEVAEVSLSLPNKHHFAVDLSPFGLENRNEVFHAADRPYGLIEGTVLREDAEPPAPAWLP
ncbi:factor-independent urate hydroxylase [Saccharothrix coeruleofusca]|uniref:Uricase n=1 Tax=Saccharothrix coeruleofusca TaxID=33919 RepID=A0A918AJV8_9PSEU|nr:urate oxidase [Saccharothrix coeruleofusca]MBP2338547.1 urate oxidase [Saccharothrix coeruleofusca]GGP47634.1 uricase [Saccharothrix coeruleofusca]